MKQPVLIIIKPDAIRKNLIGHIFQRFFETDLELVAIRAVQTSRKLVEEHYRHLQTMSFFKRVVASLLGKTRKEKNLIAFILCGSNAIKKCRAIAGATNPEEASPTSLRGAYGRITTQDVFENVVHVSSDTKEAKREIKLWFQGDPIVKKLYRS